MLKNVSRRQFIEGAGAVAAGLALAGCSSDDDEDTSEDTSEDEDTSDDTSTEDDSSEEEEETEDTESDSEESGTIVVGVMGPYTGDVAQYGIQCRNGAEIYVADLNAAGGINGKQIELIEEDEEGDATVAVTVYQKLVDDGVTAIIGDVTSTPCIAVAQESVADNMPCVTPSGTGDEITTYGDNFFRACFTDSSQGQMLAEFCQGEGITAVSTLYNAESDYETGINNMFVSVAEEYGITITGEHGYPAGTTDFSSYMTSIVAEEPEAILLPNYYTEVGLQVTKARELGFEGAMMGGDGWDTTLSGGYASAEDLEGCYYTSAYFDPTSDDEATSTFVAEFEEAYDDSPNIFGALGHDAAMILEVGLTAAEEAGLEPGSDDYKQTIIDTISTCSVEGLTGTITFNGSGDPEKGSAIFTFSDGEEVLYKEI